MNAEVKHREPQVVITMTHTEASEILRGLKDSAINGPFLTLERVLNLALEERVGF